MYVHTDVRVSCGQREAKSLARKYFCIAKLDMTGQYTVARGAGTTLPGHSCCKYSARKKNSDLGAHFRAYKISLALSGDYFVKFAICTAFSSKLQLQCG